MEHKTATADGQVPKKEHVERVLQPIERDGKPRTIKIDAEDAWMLDRWTWRVDKWGYAKRKTSTRRGLTKRDKPRSITIYLHRAILKFGPVEKDYVEVDHIDRDPTNYQKSNLRPVTPHENKTWARKNPTRKDPWTDVTK